MGLRSFRFAVLVAMACAAQPVAAHGGGPSIWDVAIAYKEAKDFHRLFKYVTGKDPGFSHGLVRSDGSRESGIYAIAYLNKFLSDFPGDVGVIFEFLIGGDPKIYKVDGKIHGKRKRSKEIWVGLTDKRWSTVAAKDVIAWRISLRDGEKELCSYESFLFPHSKEEAKELASLSGSGKESSSGEVTERPIVPVSKTGVP